MTKPTTKTAVFILGQQRSGTTALVNCLGQSMQCKTYHENQYPAMQNYRLRHNSVVRRLIENSAQQCIIFKPLIESHRDFQALWSNSRIIWCFRRVQDVVRSTINRFGSHNLLQLRAFNKGQHSWKMDGASTETLTWLKTLDYQNMTPEIASAIIWYVRNKLISRHSNALKIAYQDLTTSPEKTITRICRFINIKPTRAMWSDLHTNTAASVCLPNDLLSRCEALYEELRR